MSSVQTLTARIHRMIEQVDKHAKPLTHAFILLNNAEIAPDASAKIGPRDTVYIKRIVLAHD